MRRIVVEQRIVARDQNKVFVEKASARKLAPADAEEKYGLDRGKANAYVEFDIEPELLKRQKNVLLGIVEWFIEGDIALTDRNAEAFFNF